MGKSLGLSLKWVVPRENPLPYLEWGIYLGISHVIAEHHLATELGEGGSDVIILWNNMKDTIN